MYTKITLFRNTVLALLLFLLPGMKQVQAQTSLNAGEIAFTGYNSSNGGAFTNDFSFIILRSGGIANTTTITFTDNGWNSTLATPALGTNANDGTITWTATSAVAQFTEITIKTTTAGTAISSCSNGNAVLTSGTFLLSGSGDQVLAYQGSGTTFIAGIQMNAEGGGLGANASTLAGWDDMIGGTSPYAYSGNRSALPPGLITGTNAVMPVTGAGPYTEWDDAKYNCTGSSGAASVSALAASINNLANWSTANTTPYTLPSGCSFSIGTPPAITGQPSDATICAGSNTSFSITASNATSYQWQVNTGSGFNNVTNAGVYSGATTTTLTITGATAGMTGYTYQCIATGAISPPATSNAATLTVNSAPSITGQPSNASICASGNTSFSVTASNATGYQWQVNTGSGFANVSGAPYSGGATATLTITGATGTMNGYTYQCIVSGGCTPNATTNTVTLTVLTSNTWTGVINSAWSLAANWGCGTVPTATSDVIIPNGATFASLVNTTSAICNNLTINSGATLSFSGSINVLTVKGNLVNNGTFTASAGKVALTGSSQNIPAASYKDLQINGSGVKTLTGAASVSGTLTLTNGYLQIGSNNLTVGSAGTISGNTSSSFIITNGTGNLVVQNIGSTGKTGAIVFPVGSSSGSFTPVTLTNAGTTDNFSVRAFNNLYGTYNNDVPSSSSQSIDAVGKTWIVGEGTAGGSNVTLTLQWNGIDELPGFDENNCYLVHYSNSTNTWSLGTMGAANGLDPFFMSMSGITSFSPFGVGSIGSPLDVELISFKFSGRSADGNTQLQWVTANERNMTQYEVERSDDGVLFDYIGSVKAVNSNSATTHTYSYTDADAKTARSYYRLKMDNADGTSHYSSVVEVDRRQNGTVSYQVYPNPVDGDDLFIKTDGDMLGTQAQVVDMQGRILINKIQDNWQGKTAILNVKQLPAGTYLLRLLDSKGQLISTLRFTRK